MFFFFNGFYLIYGSPNLGECQCRENYVVCSVNLRLCIDTYFICSCLTHTKKAFLNILKIVNILSELTLFCFCHFLFVY